MSGPVQWKPLAPFAKVRQRPRLHYNDDAYLGDDGLLGQGVDGGVQEEVHHARIDAQQGLHIRSHHSIKSASVNRAACSAVETASRDGHVCAPPS